MYLDQRTKKYLKILSVIALVAVIVGCTANLDSDGNLIAERAITSSTSWSLDAGWFDFLLTIPLAKAIIWLSQFGGIIGGIVIVTIIINLLIMPIQVKATVSSQKMQMLQPQIDRIQLKYRGRNDQTSQMRMSMEINDLYKKNNISMFASLLTFITLPIMLAMWQAVQRIDIVYETVVWGIHLGVTPWSHLFSGNWGYLIIVVVVGITQFFAVDISNIMMRRDPRYKPSSQQTSMNIMNIVMTIMIVWFSLSMPTAMSLYWITTNIINIVRTVYIQLFHIERKRG